MTDQPDLFTATECDHLPVGKRVYVKTATGRDMICGKCGAVLRSE